MKETVSSYLNLVFRIGLILVILSTLFLFTNFTTDFYDTAKFLVLLIFVGVVLVLWTAKSTILGKVVLVRTPLDLPLILLLAVGGVSTFLSPSPYVSLLGHQTRIHGSLVELAVLVLFYLSLTNNLKGIKDIKFITFITIVAGAVLSAISLLTYFGVTILPSPWTHGVNFTPAGTNFSATAILALLVPILVTQILNTSKLPSLILNSLFLILYGVTIALTGAWASWVAGLLGAVLAFVLSDSGKELIQGQVSPHRLMGLFGLVVPAAIVILSLALSFTPPVAGTQNPLSGPAKNFPREIQLPFITSWKISVSAFRDSPFWGSGPATYLFNFTSYKPVEFNQSQFWNIRFDTSFNEYLGVLGMLGGVGLLAIISLTALYISSATKVLLFKNYQLPTTNYQLPSALAISGLMFFVILLLHSSTLVVWVLGILILACFWVASSEGLESPPLFSLRSLLTISQASEDTFKVEALPSVLLAISIALALFTGFFGGKYVLADIHHRNALNAVAQNNGVLAYNELVLAENLNPNADLYRTDIAQVNFALANAIAAAKAPTEASPTGSLTNQDRQNIQVLLQQSINEARTATVLSPRSAINWEVLGLLYRQISGVAQNALLFALDSYGRAIYQDPLNPLLRLNVGGTYYAIQNYDLAIRFFTDAINLKPDWTNAYYNLSVALRDKGDLNGALQAAQRTFDLVEPKEESNPDYKVAFDHLNDLKAKLPTEPQEPLAAPTTQEKEALQQKELPKVLELPKPEKIATPEAIKKPSPTPTPRP